MTKFARIVSVIICLGFLLFGVMRMGVGAALILQIAGMIDLPDLASTVTDTAVFLGQANERAIIGMGVTPYFGYIIAMGLVLVAGAVSALLRRHWGYRLIGLYLVMHGALFVNFLTVNPKIVYLAGGVTLLALLIFAQRRGYPASA